jgi:hypothetical protein
MPLVGHCAGVPWGGTTFFPWSASKNNSGKEFGRSGDKRFCLISLCVRDHTRTVWSAQNFRCSNNAHREQQQYPWLNGRKIKFPLPSYPRSTFSIFNASSGPRTCPNPSYQAPTKVPKQAPAAPVDRCCGVARPTRMIGKYSVLRYLMVSSAAATSVQAAVLSMWGDFDGHEGSPLSYNKCNPTVWGSLSLWRVVRPKV